MKSDVPILILHGWNLNAEKFAPLVQELKRQGYVAYAIDLPGFGTSQKPEKPYNLSDYIAFVNDFISKQKWKEVVIIGHSFGGRIGIKLAAQNPKYLKGLILTGAPGYNPVPKYKIAFFLALARVGDTIFSLPLLKTTKQIARKLLYKAARANDFYTTDINMQDTFKNIVKEDLVEYLPKIQIPTLLIWGQNDKITPLWIGQKMEKSIQNAKLVFIPNSRHGVPWSHPKEFTTQMKYFFK